MVEWGRILYFPDYMVSTEGIVIKEVNERVILRSYNQQGTAKVTLYSDTNKRDKAVHVLVAETFMYRPSMQYNSVIQKDMDRDNCRVSNLAWRPRWFTVRYNRQFDRHEYGYQVPIRDAETGEEFENAAAAAMANGLLIQDLTLKSSRGEGAWPTGQIFEVIQ